MKNKTLISELRKLNPEQDVHLKVNFKNGVTEVGTGNGMWESYDYLFDYTTEWDNGYLINGSTFNVRQLIDLLEQYTLSELNNENLYLIWGDMKLGFPEYDIMWLDLIDDEDEDDMPSDDDLGMDGTIDDVEYQFNGPDSIEIEIGNLSYVLAGDDVE